MSLQPVLPVAFLILLGLAATALVVWGIVLTRAHQTLRQRAVWVVRLILVWAVVVVAAQPSVPAPAPVTEAKPCVDVLLVVDRTGSMGALDWADGQLRLEGVRNDIAALVAALPDVRWSVVSWDIEAVRELPFTDDEAALLNWTHVARQEITRYSNGSSLDRPLETTLRVLTEAQARNPDNRQVMVLLSDGETTTDTQIASFEPLAPLLDDGLVLGYGTAEGARMRANDGAVDTETQEWITDVRGNPAVSHLDEAALQTAAAQMGVNYLHRTSADAAELQAWAAQLDAKPRTTVEVPGKTWLAQNWPAAVVVVLGLIAEVSLTSGGAARIRRRKR